MCGKFKDQVQKTIDEIHQAGLYKSERVIGSPQEARIAVGDGEILNLCAENYLG